MAATRNNPVHLVLQVRQAPDCSSRQPLQASLKYRHLFQAVAGVALTTVGYYSLFREDTKHVDPVESTVPQNTVIRREDQQHIQSDLDREAQNTTNKIWQVKRS